MLIDAFVEGVYVCFDGSPVGVTGTQDVPVVKPEVVAKIGLGVLKLFDVGNYIDLHIPEALLCLVEPP